MFCAGFACSAYSDHQTLAISTDQFSRKDKIKDFFLPAGSVFIAVVNVLYFLPYNIVNDFGIDVVINGIAVFYLSVVFCILKHFIDCFFCQIFSFLGADSSFAHFISNISSRVVLSIKPEDFLYDCSFCGIDYVFLVNDIVPE